jgi:hypothetical protein
LQRENGRRKLYPVPQEATHLLKQGIDEGGNRRSLCQDDQSAEEK